jgi:hypothetical protein
MPVAITRAQRDAIYETVMNHLSGIGDVWTEIENRDFTTAKRLGRAFAEDLRRLEQLGWAQEIDTDTVTLEMPRRELVRAVARLHSDAAASLDSHVSRPKDDEALARRDLAATSALGGLLHQLANAEEQPRPHDREEEPR